MEYTPYKEQSLRKCLSMYFLGSTILCEKAVLPLHLILHLQINFLCFDKLPNLNSVLFSKNNPEHWKNNTENNVQSSIFLQGVT